MLRNISFIKSRAQEAWKKEQAAGRPASYLESTVQKRAGGNWQSLIDKYLSENPGASKMEAMQAAVRKHPEAHKQYLAFVNQ